MCMCMVIHIWISRSPPQPPPNGVPKGSISELSSKLTLQCFLQLFETDGVSRWSNKHQNNDSQNDVWNKCKLGGNAPKKEPKGNAPKKIPIRPAEAG